MDYDSLLDAETVDGCKKCSSYAGLGGPTELWTRALTCGCDVCLTAFMDSSESFGGCENEDWLSAPQKRDMVPRSAADARVLRSDTLQNVDEYTSQIPARCHVAIAKKAGDEDNNSFWIAKTVGRLRVVPEGDSFIIAGVAYAVGEKYFVVEYYMAEKKVDHLPLTPENIVPNSYVKQGGKHYVHNHLVIRHYGFDMIYTKRGQSCKTTYHIPTHDENVINNLIKNGHAYFRTFKLTYHK